MNQRSVQIKGNPKSITKAVTEIYETLEKLASQVNDIDRKAVRKNQEFKDV